MAKMSTSEQLRAVIYTRISEDPRGLEAGVSRQLEDCRKLAVDRGWELAGEYSDNDISALQGKARPGYDELMAAASRGQFDRIVAYGLSRLWRNRKERAEAIDALSRTRISVALVKGSDLDLTSAAGRMYAGILGEFDTAESEIKAERVSRAAQARAEAGKANGRCPYGWKRVYQRDEQGRVLDWRDEVDPVSAEVVRSIVQDLLAGITLRAVTTRLNEMEIPSPGGGRWIPSSVRKLALRDLNIGLRRHRDTTYPGAWEPIVDEADHMKVKTLLGDPRRRTQRAAARTHLLTFGIGRCGVCGGVLAVSKKGPAGRKTSLYVCKEHGCVGRREEWVDGLVVATVCERLSRADAAAIFHADDAALAQEQSKVVALRSQLDEAADMYASGTIDREMLERITARVKPMLEAAERLARPAIPMPDAVQHLIDSHDSRAVWEELSISQRRAVLECLGVQVILKPARGGPGFKPESVELMWEPRRPT
ncbi:recombinase [Rhodococcus pyridinivorans SB3094]|uniref:Recombinase n=1 Tax=Rhodococcus pyridinivorans SB3094 TaxID=1435356 RepID=V9XDH3_9NOCA|nr:recombinase family protein [Rhodococcus pyridinivorans]AHD20050.1 recombinase [Rhodococcus pyridinivorans SB3094]